MINEQLKVLIEVIETLDPVIQDILQPHLDQLNESLNRSHKILKLIRESLTQIQLDTKYLVFDLESTRNERNEYKQQLEK